MHQSIKSTLLIVAAAFFSSFISAASAATIKVYFIGGQSNGDGRAAISGLPTSPVNLQNPQSDVQYYFHTQGSARPLDSTLTTLRPGTSETAQFGPEIGMGRALADYYAGNPSIKVAILKYANGGTNLFSQWKAGGTGTTTSDGTEYVVFQNTITAGLAALQVANPGDTIQLSGMAWMQGESDTGINATAYQTNLTNFISDIRLTYGSSLPFAIARLSNVQTAVNDLSTIRIAQQNVAALSPYNVLVNTDNFGQNGDNLHFNTAGQLALGQEFASALIAVPEPGTLGLLGCGVMSLIFAAVRRRKTDDSFISSRPPISQITTASCRASDH